MPSIDPLIAPGAPGTSLMLIAGAALLRFGRIFENAWTGALGAPPEPFETELFERMRAEHGPALPAPRKQGRRPASSGSREPALA